MILSQVQELEDVGMPRLDVDGKGTRPLVATLIDISCGVVKDAKHRYNTIRGPVSTADIRAGSSDAVDVEPNPTGSLGDHGARLERIIDPLNTVFLDID